MALDLDLIAARVAERLNKQPDDVDVVACVEAAVRLIELDTGYGRDDITGTDELVNRGLTLMAERAFHDPATRKRTVDVFGDQSFEGPIIPARLRSGIADNYWSHLGKAPPAVDEDGNPTESVSVHRGWA